MTATPARDALRHLLVDYYANADLLDHEVIDLTVEALLCPDEHSTVLAALVESGWRPTADQLRAMGAEPATLTNVEWPLDLGTCPYNQRGKPGADPNGTCSFGCYDEPECQTYRPREGWPSDRGEMPEPWVYTAKPMALPHPGGHDVTVWAFPEGVDGD